MAHEDFVHENEHVMDELEWWSVRRKVMDMSVAVLVRAMMMLSGDGCTGYSWAGGSLGIDLYRIRAPGRPRRTDSNRPTISLKNRRDLHQNLSEWRSLHHGSQVEVGRSQFPVRCYS